MKILLLIRHAKSSWDNSDQGDLQRPLNDRGKRDAPIMARRLQKAGISPDRLVSSPATRALQTAEAFNQVFGGDKKAIKIVADLYHASPSAFREVLAGLDNGDQTVAMFSHNPGITAFVNMLTAVRVDNMPTCSIFAVQSNAEGWSDFVDAGVKFWFFDYPKNAGHD
jgi:phosphohistidine phosphatase